MLLFHEIELLLVLEHLLGHGRDGGRAALPFILDDLLVSTQGSLVLHLFRCLLVSLRLFLLFHHLFDWFLLEDEARWLEWLIQHSLKRTLTRLLRLRQHFYLSFLLFFDVT